MYWLLCAWVGFSILELLGTSEVKYGMYWHLHWYILAFVWCYFSMQVAIWNWSELVLVFLLLLQELMQDMSKTQSKEWSLFCERAASCPGMESSSVCFGHLVFYDSSVIVQSIWSFCLYMFWPLRLLWF
jgi:hypothetical protein